MLIYGEPYLTPTFGDVVVPKPLIAVLGLLLLALTACGPAAATNPTDPAGDQSASAGDGDEARTTAVADVRAGLPDEAPEKVVVMSVALTEILDAIGVVPAGVPSSQTPLPKSVADVPRVGSVIAPDIEKVTGMQPDLILGPSSIKDSLEKKFSSTDLSTAYVPTDSLDDLVHTALALGELYGSSDEATALVDEVDTARDEAVASTDGADPSKVLILFGAGEDLTVMSEDTYAGGIASALGATNVATELGVTEPYSPLSMEKVIATDPDVILFLAHGDTSAAEKQMKSQVEGNQAWAKLRAVQEGNLRALDYGTFFSASLTHTPEAFRDMATALAP